MRFAFYDENGRVISAFNDETVIELPTGAVELTEEQFDNRFNYQLIDGVLTFVPPQQPPLTQDQIYAAGFRLIKSALQKAIDTKAQSLDFSSGNSLILYAGFANPFNALALQFAEWEASVWVAAEQYKQQVLAGTKPLPTIEEAVSMMPPYPV